ncbi:YOR020W-A [Saccharomyces arboricola H-6]|uniref:YOR020W-A n=1 Tax=Saccharomyces arboricola (strain H-6 / AS 2.3317 / CBS 10644) TaxID=1160507 RepID=J8Q2A4_SACAR|nr:YOR020W-A [Saccharomyces arboricola H-6]
MGAAYKIFGKSVQPHVLAISTFIATAALTSYFTMKPKSKDETKNISPLNAQRSTANASEKDDDVMKSIEGFLNDLEKDAKQDTKAN